MYRKALGKCLALFVLMICGMHISACDNAVEEEENGHFEAIGLRLVYHGGIVYQVREGEVECDFEACGVFLTLGTESDQLTATFFDVDLNAVAVSEHEADFSMQHVLETNGVVEFQKLTGDDEWRFHLHPLSAGSTRLQLRLMHGEHADFVTPPVSDEKAINIVVTE